jgi:glycosyltransferase involved in cell wall biosynthesis/cellulose synthase/poly-beta-1,6-N-acetylglucosamine synthase-like glycosyltransferase/O-antigen/teichoic acid export membrane protein
MNPDGLSIIIPTFNEASSISSLITRLTGVLEKQHIAYEIIIIDDNSTDRIKDKIKAYGIKFPIRFFLKKGKKGKGYSIMEGASYASFEYIAMLDADLQYPPEIIPELYQQAKTHGFAVANRKTYQSSLFRKIASRLNAFLFGRVLLQLKTDVQSGLKIFRSEVFEHLNPRLVSAWGIDIPLIFTAHELGFHEGRVDIDFRRREDGVSKVRFLSAVRDIAAGALKTKLAKRRIYHLKPEGKDSMLGSGLAYKRNRFITHTTLPHHQSALVTFTVWQKLVVIGALGFLAFGFSKNSYQTAIAFVGVLSAIYFLDVLFNLFVLLKSLHFPPEIKISDEELEKIDNAKLPLYTILCPLYREARVLPQFARAMEELDWPKDKLEVLLLLEEDDTATIETAKNLQLPAYFKMNIVPHSLPKTKPKACNYGLTLARGEYIVVFDAEDKPEAQQLKKAYLAFGKTPKNVACLQAKLNYYNPRHNLLTRFFTAEYSLWFDVILPGLQSIDTTIPLGGTSNHFRTSDLLLFQGWDPFNVTEDCDLGARLFKAGYKTAIVDTITLEEANSNVKNWLRQRSRWIKGYLQTYLVHMRNPVKFIAAHGSHAFIFQLIVGGKIAFMVINPILWLITISYFTLYALVGPTIESLFPAVIFYMAAFALVAGNFICLYNYMIGCAKRDHWDLIKYIFFVPFYWLMISVAAGIAIFQLFVKPHYWEKTIHGFHIDEKEKEEEKDMLAIKSQPTRVSSLQWLSNFIGSPLIAGSILIIASLFGNVCNFLYNAYLGRTVSLEDFGIITLIGSFVYISQVPLGALGRAVTFKSAFLFGKYETAIQDFWRTIRRKGYLLSLVVAVLWLGLTPWLGLFFNVESIIPFLLFTPVWVIGTLAAVDGGFLGGNLKFGTLAVLVVTEALSKLVFSVALVENGLGAYVYAAIPLSMTVSFAIGWWRAFKTRGVPVIYKEGAKTLAFPKKFFLTSILTSLTGVTYLSLDVILAKHYLAPSQAGAYGFLSLAGKMVYFLGSLFSQFTIPMVSREIGAGRKTGWLFAKILVLVLFVTFSGFIAFGLLGDLTVPFLWGGNANSVVPYLSLYAFAMVCFSISSLFITYHQVRGEYLFPVVGFLFGLLPIVGISLHHSDIEAITDVVALSSLITFFGILLLDRTYGTLVLLYRSVVDFFGLFGKLPIKEKLPGGKLRILIFNWRDIRHIWSGGAEVYIHELSKRWVRMGNEVTIFCGNDGKSERHEIIEGVRIIRRGGFYLVYLWAILYYLFRLSGKYDVIIDSENGIPFFTPFYAKEKVFLLIHHVHQEVFRKRLLPPLSWIGMILEKRVMPIAYRNTEVITVSPSSKTDILDHKLTKKEPHIVYNGVDLSLCNPGEKSKTPMVLYLGRLTSLKSLSVLINAAKKIIKRIPEVCIVIAGDGQDKPRLMKLVQKLHLEDIITFRGRVSEKEKVELYQQAWVFVNPSVIEGWGITTIEANACGTPVVAANVQGLRDAIHNPHSGVLVPYGNPDELARSVVRILKDTRMRNKMSRESRDWAEKFDWERSAKESLKLLQT